MYIHWDKMGLAVPVLIACAVSFSGCQDRPTSVVEPSFAKGGNPGPSQPRYTLSFHFPLPPPDQGSNLIVGDGRVRDDETGGFTAYTGGQCGVGAVFFGGAPYLFTANDRIKQSESTFCQGTEARTFAVDFPEEAYDLDENGDTVPVTLAWNGQSVAAAVFEIRNQTSSPYRVRDLPLNETLVKQLWITFVDKSGHPGGVGWGDACPGLLRFDEEWGATGVQVTRVKQQSQGYTYDEWEVNSGPDAVAACLGNQGGEFYLLATTGWSSR